MDAAHWETPWLLTPNFEMTFFPFWCQFPIFVDLMGQRKDASLGSKAELCSFSKSFFFNRDTICKWLRTAPGFCEGPLPGGPPAAGPHPSLSVAVLCLPPVVLLRGHLEGLCTAWAAEGPGLGAGSPGFLPSGASVSLCVS